MSSTFKLEQLFNQCDTRGTGFIDQKEFRDLCRGFDIDNNDADIIFYDLDHDGDGKISFEDFAFGFRDFVTPGARRGSIQLGLESPGSNKKMQAVENGQQISYIEALGMYGSLVAIDFFSLMIRHFLFFSTTC